MDWPPWSYDPERIKSFYLPRVRNATRGQEAKGVFGFWPKKRKESKLLSTKNRKGKTSFTHSK
jgi:hypothetical protein